MQTDFRSLERRYGTVFATRINEEISRVEMKKFNFYKVPDAIKALYAVLEDEIEFEKIELPKKSNRA